MNANHTYIVMLLCAVFVIFFAMSEEVERVVKMLFHTFGVIDGFYGVIYLYYNFQVFVCVSLKGCG